jgi:hypothetical protein
MMLNTVDVCLYSYANSALISFIDHSGMDAALQQFIAIRDSVVLHNNSQIQVFVSMFDPICPPETLVHVTKAPSPLLLGNGHTLACVFISV